MRDARGLRKRWDQHPTYHFFIESQQSDPHSGHKTPESEDIHLKVWGTVYRIILVWSGLLLFKGHSFKFRCPFSSCLFCSCSLVSQFFALLCTVRLYFPVSCFFWRGQYPRHGRSVKQSKVQRQIWIEKGNVLGLPVKEEWPCVRFSLSFTLAQESKPRRGFSMFPVQALFVYFCLPWAIV